ncbi:hypothetical protein SLITO_v1c07330 [Spiroplasma litorale]|uniref:Uncharacterized protein n=1 Tax=Spiroplasma litorale TaxID=216942 RepID=A0A0K1W2G0_9MOLU|nr:hypothetical protein [Spiroplasma litorale]AKX34358.1 hypothetical protein SLITO_v1c07330 [Spiroplasma litorale]
MESLKKQWTNLIKNYITNKYEDVEFLFESNYKEIDYFYNKNNLKTHLHSDLVIKTKTNWFVFKFYTDDDYEYRFLEKNNNFYKVNRTNRLWSRIKDNLVRTYKINKIHLDNFNQLDNKFFIIASYIEFDEFSDSIFGLKIDEISKKI